MLLSCSSPQLYQDLTSQSYSMKLLMLDIITFVLLGVFCLFLLATIAQYKILEFEITQLKKTLQDLSRNENAITYLRAFPCDGAVLNNGQKLTALLRCWYHLICAENFHRSNFTICPSINNSALSNYLGNEEILKRIISLFQKVTNSQLISQIDQEDVNLLNNLFVKNNENSFDIRKYICTNNPYFTKLINEVVSFQSQNIEEWKSFLRNWQQVMIKEYVKNFTLDQQQTNQAKYMRIIVLLLVLIPIPFIILHVIVLAKTPLFSIIV